MNLGIGLVIAFLCLLIGVAIGYALHTYIKNREQKRLQITSDLIINEAKEQAHLTELQAKDKALEIRQAAEAEVARRRAEIGREEDRLLKRREEIDNRADRLEKREQALNKRQSAVDKRANEIDKLHEQQLEELQRISQLSTEEARALLLAEVEKDSRQDMARIIRQIETEAQEEG